MSHSPLEICLIYRPGLEIKQVTTLIENLIFIGRKKSSISIFTNTEEILTYSDSTHPLVISSITSANLNRTSISPTETSEISAITFSSSSMITLVVQNRFYCLNVVIPSNILTPSMLKFFRKFFQLLIIFKYSCSCLSLSATTTRKPDSSNCKCFIQ